MMALFGWDNPDQARKYVRAANQKKMAREAAKHVAPTVAPLQNLYKNKDL
jgi:hypothetical protein